MSSQGKHRCIYEFYMYCKCNLACCNGCDTLNWTGVYFHPKFHLCLPYYDMSNCLLWKGPIQEAPTSSGIMLNMSKCLLNTSWKEIWLFCVWRRSDIQFIRDFWNTVFSLCCLDIWKYGNNWGGKPTKIEGFTSYSHYSSFSLVKPTL